MRIPVAAVMDGIPDGKPAGVQIRHSAVSADILARKRTVDINADSPATVVRNRIVNLRSAIRRPSGEL